MEDTVAMVPAAMVPVAMVPVAMAPIAGMNRAAKVGEKAETMTTVAKPMCHRTSWAATRVQIEERRGAGPLSCGRSPK